MTVATMSEGRCLCHETQAAQLSAQSGLWYWLRFIAQACIESLDVAVFPWTARLDVERGDVEPSQPFAHRVGDELRTVVGPDMLR